MCFWFRSGIFVCVVRGYLTLSLFIGLLSLLRIGLSAIFGVRFLRLLFFLHSTTCLLRKSFQIWRVNFLVSAIFAIFFLLLCLSFLQLFCSSVYFLLLSLRLIHSSLRLGCIFVGRSACCLIFYRGHYLFFLVNFLKYEISCEEIPPLNFISYLKS